MAATFQRDGIRFDYPENWRMETEEADNGWTVSVQSPETAFFLLAFDGDMPEMELVAETALSALKEDYPDLEAEENFESVAGQPAVGHDVRFFSMDLTNTCWLRSFYGGSGTVLAMWQSSDLELPHQEQVLRAIGSSLEVEEEEEEEEE